MAGLCVGFIGLGLIGGSIARALRENTAETYMMAYDVNASTLEKALQDGVIDEATEGIDERFSRCDYLFLCAGPSSHLSLLYPDRCGQRQDRYP